MIAIWSSTCKLRKPGDRAEAVVRLSTDGLSEVWDSAGLRISGTWAALEEPQGPSMLGSRRGTNYMVGITLRALPTSLSCSKETEAKSALSIGRE